jgi:hypothetical protein
MARKGEGMVGARARHDGMPGATTIPHFPPSSKSSVSVENHMNFVQFRYAQEEDPPTLAPHSIAFRPWTKSASGFVEANGAGPLATRHQRRVALRPIELAQAPQRSFSSLGASGTETLR